MKPVVLHEINNPTQKKYIDADDFDTIEALGTGSSIRLKSSDMPIAVHEAPDEAMAIILGDK